MREKQTIDSMIKTLTETVEDHVLPSCEIEFLSSMSNYSFIFASEISKGKQKSRIFSQEQKSWGIVCIIRFKEINELTAAK